MRKPLSAFLVLLLMALPLVGVIVAVAYAADLCLGVGLGPPACPSCTGTVGAVVVVKDVGGGKTIQDLNNALRKSNKCQQLSGFTSDEDLGVTATSQRTIPGGLFGNVSLCTSSDATHVTVISNFLGRSIQTEIPLPIPANPASNALSDVLDLVDTPSGTGVPTTAAICSPPNVPVP